MKGSELRLVEYMEGSKRRFVIPVYQRNYDWKTENCKQLYNDLVKVVRNSRSSHFFGSIVSVYNPDGRNTEFLVIDGQQRLTTVSLLMLAMYNLMQKGIIIPSTPTLAQQIYEDYLVDKWQPKETRVKLKSVKDDQKAFNKLFEDESEHIMDSNLTVNYKYFYDRIQKQEVTVDELYDAIGKLEIINITLNGEDNPQLIFESLNSTGLALSEGDKIRNYVLMGLSPKLQQEYYEKYWNKIEIFTGYDVSALVRDYLSIKQQAIPSFNKIYFMFKAYMEEERIEIESFLKNLLLYAKRFETLAKGNTTNKVVNACINRLNRLETTVTRPFFLEVLRLLDEGKLNIAEVSEVFLTTENYLFRRLICNLPTNALNKIFLTLHRDIIRFDKTENDYVEKFKYVLLSRKERTSFPSDNDFVEEFSKKQVYSTMNNKNKVYILERLENYGTSEDKDIYRHIDDGSYSIEHIMPQHLTPLWMKSIGDNYEAIHEEWCHRIGNLTLTAYNSKYSNSTFEEKKNMKNGFKESGIRLNSYIANFEKWGLEEIQERTKFLMKKACEVWARPLSTYQPPVKPLDTVGLDDDISLTGRNIAGFSFRNAEQQVLSWIEMFEQVLGMLHTEDKSVLRKIAFVPSDENDFSSYVGIKKELFRSPWEIDTGIFIERSTSTDTKINLLRQFFKLYNQNPEDLVFILKEKTDDPGPDPGSLQEKFEKYWHYALPIIRDAFVNDGCFSKVNPSRDNSINGWFGISGFSVLCVASTSGSRVAICFAKQDRTQNKEAFDKAYRHKMEIEVQLGTSLEWNRHDDLIGSRIIYNLSGVNIKNEEDWPKMAKLHAEWSKKLYDAIVPYLR